MEILHKIKYKQVLLAMLLFIGIAAVSQSVSAQNAEKVVAKGSVTDTAGMPLIGVTVMVKETSKGTLTDANGSFSIECAKGSTLRFSYLGYKTAEYVAGAAEMKISLADDNINLGEVVVVGIGYGTMRKSDLTGAISSVSSDKLNKGVITTSEQLLQGKIAGLTIVRSGGDPSQGASIRLRGGTSLTAGNGPLIVIDGVAGADFNSVSPSDISSVDVLKDASAAAIYGSRGANGVIIVTTKKPQEGRSNIEYNSYVAMGTAAKNYDLLSANQWRDYVRKNNVGGAVDYGANTDWQKEMERTALSHSHALSLDGGNAKTAFRASLNYLDNQGIIKSNDLSRLGGAINVSQKGLNDKLKIEVNLSNTFDKYTPINYMAFERALNLNPTIPVKDADGKYVEVDGLGYENPVAIIEQPDQDETRQRFMGFTKADLQLFDGLTATTNISYTLNTHQKRYYVPSDARVIGKENTGFGQRTLDDGSNYQLESYLNYDKKIGEHAFNIMGGYSYLYSMYEGFGALRKQFATDLFTYNNLGSGIKAEQGDVYSYKNDNKLISFFGRVNYNYKSKYMVTATLRRDGSSKFGANNKWGLFPSVSGAWRVSDESFMEPLKGLLNNLKFRAGYGVTGNQEGISSYSSITLLGQPSDNVAGYRYFQYSGTGIWKTAYGPTQNSNPDLKWEETAQFNVGADFTVLNRINGTVELYHKYTSDLLFTYTVPMPPAIFGRTLANVGNLTNNGIEISLSAQLLNTDGFKWSIDANYAYNTQKIDKLSDQLYKTESVQTGLLTGLRGMSGVFSQLVKEGFVAGTFYGYKCDSIDKSGKYVFHDVNGDKKIDKLDMQVLGDVQPDFTAGLGMTFEYMNLDFSFLFNGIFGQKLFNATYMSIMDDARIPTYNVPDAALTDALKAPSNFSDYWIEDGSFIRLQNLSLGYTFPCKSKTYFKKARIYVSAENLFVITKYSGLDPEISLDGLDSPGIERFNSYPKPRLYSFGLSVSF